MSSQMLYLIPIVFNNLTGKNFGGQEYKNYLKMMFHDFPKLSYGEIELWEDGKMTTKGDVKKY